MIGFTERNLKLFFKDKSSVFFSLLAVFIIIGLYALFLGDVWVKSFSNLNGVRFLMNSWIMAGLLAVTSVTTTMGAFGIMVYDKANKITKDFASSPLKRSSIVGGYTLSSFIIGVIMCLVTLILFELYIVSNGGKLMGLNVLIRTFGLILLSTFTNTSIILFITSYFNSGNAFATASTIIGTMIGFLTGIYLPVGQLPEGVRFVVKVFPISHAATLLRQVIMEEPISASFSGAPVEVADSFKQLMGINFKLGNTMISATLSIGILLLTAILFYVLSVWNLMKKRK